MTIPNNFVENTDPTYGEDWLVFETPDCEYRLAGFYYHKTGYRIEVTIPGDRIVITSDFSEEDTLREDHPEALPWMKVWWELYNSSPYVE